MQRSTNERTITELDHVRLSNLIQRGRQDGSTFASAAAIQELLDEATVVPTREVPHDMVTMYSQVQLSAPNTAQRQTLTVCYPADADAGTGFVSVLSPVGRSLLGLRVGETARWTTPAGEQKSAEIVAVVFQPEASGDFTT